jgi:hypothetical protein
MADTSVAEPSAPVSNTEETIVTTVDAAENTPEDQQVQTVKKTKMIRRKKKPARIQVDPSTMKTESPAQPGADCKLKTNHFYLGVAC